ncbi:MAG: DUF4097 domain-containing protein [Firmicutes bacterium]|nr:DUF4097 domain-containing protein [Bacillota bacterium]
MKGTARIWLIAAAALICIGILVFCCALAVVHGDIAALGNNDYQTHTWETGEAFRSISILSDTEDIALLPSEDEKCRVVFYEREKEKHSAAVEQGTLSIEKTDAGSWLDHIEFFSVGTAKITIYLPQAEYDSLFIEEDTGDIVLSKDLTFDSVDISTDTGNIDCYASSARRMRMESDTGDIRMENLSAGEIDLAVDTGRVEIRSVGCRGDLAVSAGAGETLLSGVSCNNLSSGGSTGHIILENVIAAAMITLTRDTGDVRLEQCDAAELLIETATGDVSGSLLSDKVFITQSDTGSITVPESISGGKCKITTDTGDISIVIP